MGLLSGPISLTPNGGQGLRPQPQGKVSLLSGGLIKEEDSKTLDAACVSDVARPHRGGRATRGERPVEEVADDVVVASGDSCAETQEPCLVRSPSGSKLENVATRFPFGARFSFWLRRGGAEGAKSQELTELGSCTEVLSFWKYWNSIAMDRLPPSALLGVFRGPERPRVGLKAAGGKWVVSPTKEDAAGLFEELTLALVGGEFDETNEGAPCGVAFSKDEGKVEVWNRSASDAATEPMLLKLREFVGQEVVIEYVPHRQGAKAV